MTLIPKFDTVERTDSRKLSLDFYMSSVAYESINQCKILMGTMELGR